MKKLEKNMIINFINLFLGLFLFFLFFTNFELNSTIANLLFPMCVLVFGKISFRKLTKPQKSKILFYLPSYILPIGFYVVKILIGLVFFMSTMFWISEEQNKTRIQRSYSPNKIEYCDVYHYPVGAYSSGAGRLRVFFVNRIFPFVRKELYYESSSHIYIEVTENTESYYTNGFDMIEWKDKDNITIFSVGKDYTVNVRKISFFPYEIIKNLNSKE